MHITTAQAATRLAARRDPRPTVSRRKAHATAGAGHASSLTLTISIDDAAAGNTAGKHRRNKQSARTRAPPPPDDSSRRTELCNKPTTTKTQSACERRTRCERPPPVRPPACNASTPARANDVPTPPKPPQRGVARVAPSDAHDAHPQTRVPTSDEQPRARAKKATCSCAAVLTCGVCGARRQTPTRWWDIRFGWVRAAPRRVALENSPTHAR